MNLHDDVIRDYLLLLSKEIATKIKQNTNVNRRICSHTFYITLFIRYSKQILYSICN